MFPMMVHFKNRLAMHDTSLLERPKAPAAA